MTLSTFDNNLQLWNITLIHLLLCTLEVHAEIFLMLEHNTTTVYITLSILFDMHHYPK